jgi:hypothetical protein
MNYLPFNSLLPVTSSIDVSRETTVIEESEPECFTLPKSPKNLQLLRFGSSGLYAAHPPPGSVSRETSAHRPVVWIRIPSSGN